LADQGASPTEDGAHCLSDGLGAPACSSGPMPGAVADPDRAGQHVGNPIEVASGNKYQREVDFSAFASGLAFVRHYNSLLSDVNRGLGPGWRHSYQVSLVRVGPGTLRLTQADGRMLHFTRAPGDAGPYRGETPASGEVVVSAQAVRWQVPDGRVFLFDRGWLSAIDFNDSRGQLRIARHGTRVAAVADSRGAVLQLHWAEQAVLPDYDGPRQHGVPQGALEAITLPNGHRIAYGYDADGRPSEAAYPDGTWVRYRHEQGGLPALLVERQASWEAGARTWAYDDDGLAVYSSAGGGVRIDRSGDRDAADVTWGDDRVNGAKRWTPPDRRLDGDRSDSDSGTPTTPASGTESVTVARKHGDSIEALAKQIVHVVTIDPDSGVHEAKVALQGREAPVELVTDRLGRIMSMEVGDVSGERLLAELVTGGLPGCSSGNGSSSSVARLAELVAGRPACRGDALATTELRDAVQAVADSGAAGPLSAHRFATRVPLPTVSSTDDHPGSWKPEPDPCTMPAGENCDTLTEKRAMAQLSQCAYRAGVCDTDYRAVSAAAVYLEDRDFHNAGFDAELYHDWRNDRYVVAFRGTDNVGDDWDANFRQGRGERARQYDLAVQLADKLQRAIPGTEVVFTGHSLGGGLASAASLQASSTATVFNAAALHPDTAQAYGFEDRFADARNSIDVVRTYSDPISRSNAAAERLGLFGAQRAPGAHTVLANPDGDWASERTWAVPIDALMVWHSIDAVIESLERLLEKFCGLVRYPY